MKANLNTMSNLAAAAAICKPTNIKSALQAAVESTLNRMPVDKLVEYLSTDRGMFLYIPKDEINPTLTSDEWSRVDEAADYSFETSDGVVVNVTSIYVLRTEVKVTAYISLAK